MLSTGVPELFAFLQSLVTQVRGSKEAHHPLGIQSLDPIPEGKYLQMFFASSGQESLLLKRKRKTRIRYLK